MVHLGWQKRTRAGQTVGAWGALAPVQQDVHTGPGPPNPKKHVGEGTLMRDAYHEELDSISDSLVEMARLVGSAIGRAT